MSNSVQIRLDVPVGRVENQRQICLHGHLRQIQLRPINIVAYGKDQIALSLTNRLFQLFVLWKKRYMYVAEGEKNLLYQFHC